MKKVLSVAIALILGLSPILAQEFSVENSDGVMIYYNVIDAENHKVEVNASPEENQYEGTVAIPESVVYDEIDYSVTAIGAWAFNKCSGVNEVTMGESIVEIHKWAFAECTGLTSVVIPNSVIVIQSSAFNKCSGLTTVTIGNHVDTIGNGAFGHTALTEIEIPNSVRYLSGFNNTHLVSINIPNSVTIIGKQAFDGCEELTNVVIGEGVTKIDWMAFSRCIRLSTIEMPSSVEYIEISAFEDCSGLLSVTIGEGVDTIQSKVFNNCSALEWIKVDALTPPIIKSNTFKGVTMSIPVYVPCDVVESYRSDAMWGQFTNIRCEGDEGIAEMGELNKMKVYPNPTCGMVHIDVEGVNRIEVIDMAGVKVVEFLGENMIDISELNNGVYVMRISTSEGTTVRRIVKR